MGKYLKEVRRHAEKIKHFYEYAGSRGHSQARHYFNELSDLMLKAHGSAKDKNDVRTIYEIYKSAKQMMDEMEERAASDNSK